MITGRPQSLGDLLLRLAASVSCAILVSLLLVEPASASDSSQLNTSQIGVQSFEKSATPTSFIASGDRVTYTVDFTTVLSAGVPITKTVVVTDLLPQQLSLLGGSMQASQGIAQAVGQAITWTVSFPTDLPQTFVLTYVVETQPCPWPAEISNQASLFEIASSDVLTPSGEVISSVATLAAPFDGCKVYLPLIEKALLIEPLQQIVNSGFDDDAVGTGWNVINGPLIFDGLAIGAFPHSPPNVAWFGGEFQQTEVLEQSITQPANYEIKLQFYYWLASVQAACNDADRLSIFFNNKIWSVQLCVANETFGWKLGEFNLGVLSAPHTGKLAIRGFLNNVQNSNILMDSLKLCSTDAAAPPGTPTCD